MTQINVLCDLMEQYVIVLLFEYITFFCFSFLDQKNQNQFLKKVIAPSLAVAVQYTPLENAVAVFENGTLYTGSAELQVMTGTSDRASPNRHCNDWKAGNPNMDVGDASRVDRNWLRSKCFFFFFFSDYYIDNKLNV